MTDVHGPTSHSTPEPLAVWAGTSAPETLARLLDLMSAPAACHSWPDGRCLYANDAYAAFGGWQTEDVIERTLGELWGESLYAELAPLIGQAPKTGGIVRYRGKHQRPDGAFVPMELSLLATRDGRHVYLVIDDVARDTPLRQSSEPLDGRLERFFLASTTAMAFLCDGVVVAANSRLAELLDVAASELPGQPIEHLVVCGGRYETLGPGTCSLRRRSGQHVPVELEVHDVCIDGHHEQLMVVHLDRSQSHSLAYIRHLALHDPLSGLPNRRQINEYLEASIAAAQSLGQRLAVIFLDVDRFKRVNDSLGHAAGDELLLECARRLREFCAARTAQSIPLWVARVGGDEFVLVLAIGDGSDVDTMQTIADLRQALSAPIRLGSREFTISTSIGIAFYPEHGTTPQELMKNADTAMYAAKAAGRDTVRRFTPTLAQAALQALTLESELLQALERREFVLYFQPIITETGRLASAEALLRWKHPRRGILAPDHFIESAESSRVMRAIGLWVLEEALHQANLWTRVGWSSARVAVNLSDSEFRSPAFIPTLEALLRKYSLSGRALEVELTEHIVMSDELGAYTTLEVLKSLGVTIALDDFGTGYSSFSRLRELPLDRIKIASEFIRDLPEAPTCRAIVHSIVELARGLGLSLVAEGVENKAQLEALHLLGCREAQGYLFGRPMSSGDFGRWLRQNQTMWAAKAA